MKSALIIGALGQDGSYLTKLLLSKKYYVIGTTRNIKNIKENKNHKILGIKYKAKIIVLNYTVKKNVKDVILRYKPSEIYFLSSVSTIKESINNIHLTLKSIVIGTNVILDVCKLIDKERKIKIFFAGSTECFGNLEKKEKFFDENSSFSPRNPYAIAKTASFNMVKYYRDFYCLNCCTGILSNHESKLRKNKFVTTKIINYLNNFDTNKTNSKLILGNINIKRDWGWAPEFVESFWLILNSKNIDDYIIATGKPVALTKFLDYAFKKRKLNWKNYVVINSKLQRKNDIKDVNFKVTKIYKKIGWKAKSDYKTIIDKMIIQN